jgi:hypothetical protein
MQRPRASGKPPMAKPKGNPKGKDESMYGALTPTRYTPSRGSPSSRHLLAGWQRELQLAQCTGQAKSNNIQYNV